ncbi:hypothetical protein IEU95_01230 [Hoyosella rhizosphaerae]|uniref:DUF6286 domain-containing protein n=1 Tax=Hoyosella rhizosphaerae TaxID=1755582 RepID=A0A916XIU4_9ACTN|nr:DUF6286 domain-containing protein [Hoyosella rhizosphaerae]MBN4925440.1 hypothetical protein [Hoyosella rhizosphaerae]GGC75182.1 hypothetical protein GCM10011410_30610 [Hoyosella rhizosphaerae]
MTTRAPKARPAAIAGAVTVIALLIGIAAVTINDLLVSQQWVTGQTVIPQALTTLDGQTPQPWFVPVGAGIAVLGVLFLYLAVKPRATTRVAGSEQTVWFAPRAIADLARTTALDTVPVVKAKASATKRKVTVTATVFGSPPADLSDTIKQRLTERFSALARTPKIAVRIRQEGANS